MGVELGSVGDRHSEHGRRRRWSGGVWPGGRSGIDKARADRAECTPGEGSAATMDGWMDG